MIATHLCLHCGDRIVKNAEGLFVHIYGPNDEVAIFSCQVGTVPYGAVAEPGRSLDDKEVERP